MPVVARLPIQDAYLVTVSRPRDHRGYFNELYNERDYPSSLRGSIGGDWKQVAVSQTERVNTVRGLHMSPYNKLCAVLSGAIYDVIVDMRSDSPTFLKWCGVYLSEANQRQVHIPARCLHGFLCLVENTRMLYLQGGVYSPEFERDCYPFDPLLNVHWPMLQISGADLVISNKDRDAPAVTHATRFPELAARAPSQRVLIIGASGQVGCALVHEYSRRGFLVYGTHNKNIPSGMGLLTVGFDLEMAATDQSAIDDLLAMMHPDIVIICSALTAADQLESDSQKERVRATNVDGPRMIAETAQKRGAKVVMYSTEYVWDGGDGPYSEEDAVRPLNVYGQSKADMETAVLAADPTALILRTTVVYGPEMQGKNFVYQLCRKLMASESMMVPIDQVSTPTYNRDLALATRLLVEEGACGIFNVCGTERMNRYEFALAFADMLGLRKDLITPVRTADLQQKARRPLDAGMKVDKLIRFLSGKFQPRDIKEAFRDWTSNPGSQNVALPRVTMTSSSYPSSARL